MTDLEMENYDRYRVPNSSFSASRIIIFSRSSPKDPMGTLAKEYT